MKIDINLPQEQIELLAAKLGYKAEIEDTSQPLDGDSYPLIPNPVTLLQFTEAIVNGKLVEIMQDRFRSELRADLDNRYARAVDSIQSGVFDDELLASETSDVLLHLRSVMFDG